MAYDTIAPENKLVEVVATYTTSVDPDAEVFADVAREDIVIFYSDDDTAAAQPIDTTLQKTAIETSTLGTYQAGFAGSDFLNFLPQRTGRLIYEVVKAGMRVVKSTPLLVVATE